MIEVPFSVLKFLHSNYSHLISTNEDKYDINDTNRVPYIAKFNRVIPNLFCVGDENGYIRFFKSSPKLTILKDISAEKSCIYDIQWLSSYELACGGGDKYVSLFDVNTCTKTAILKGHTESIKSISKIDDNPFVIASGARDGSILIYDTRCNKTDSQETNSLNESYTISTVRPVHTILKAHFIDNSPTPSIVHNHSLHHNNNQSTSSSSRVLKSRTSNFLNVCNTTTSSNNCYSSAFKKSTSVSCVLFQNDFHLASSGATDGLIKLWDIRKIHPVSSNKKCLETVPIFIFDNQMNNSLKYDKLNHSKNVKGYSNLLFNRNKTSLYANCMNNFIYNYNFLTYNNNHTRIINETSYLSNENKKSTLNINQSNFIKSSLSNCDNFLLTGSSDFNAYIFSTNINNNLKTFKKLMPVIVLRGHTNEVTTVDWNPIDSNQIVTCSDDNSIRVWYVQREKDLITSKESEFNFCKAEVVEEISDNNNDENKESTSNTNKISNLKPDSCFKSSIKFNSRIYNKYRPHCTNMHDDYFFNGFENKNFRLNSNLSCDDYSHKKTDIENELCSKYEKINIENNQYGHTCLMKSSTTINDNFGREKFFLKLENPLSNLPTNLIVEPALSKTLTLSESNKIDEMVTVFKQEDLSLKAFGFKRQNSFTTLLSTSLKVENQPKTVRSKLKAKTLNRQKISQNCATPSRKEKNADLQNTPNRISTNTVSTSTAKKRAVDLSSIKENKSNDNFENQEPRTPQSKRRLIMTSIISNDAQTTPNKLLNSNGTNMLGSPARTILHYFSPKAIGK